MATSVVVAVQQQANQPGEWLMVELQGALEFVGGGVSGADLEVAVATMTYSVDQTKARLIIGTNVLEGTVQQLAKPFAVIQASKQTSATWEVQAFIKKKVLFNTRPKHILAQTGS
ncbi:hypothetical protein Pelo_12607 [Pelomyxa schiedti]|nr:hypothetical protein Pelo_12607 [Pelomyxa schiedti]